MSPYNDTVFKTSLIILCFMILGMVLIGGLTRLTGSGLSIVEWNPVTGALPPLTNAEWIMEFSKYQHSPEFQKINFGITLGEFKAIFFLEYIHRLWGRLIGVVLLIPTFLMLFKKCHKDLMSLLLLLWILGLAQGLMGWLMVKSGLIHDPHVSPYRLCAHLFLGFMIFGTALWITLMVYRGDHIVEGTYEKALLRSNPVFWKFSGLLRSARNEDQNYERALLGILQRGVLAALFLILITALFGAFVAGHKAGLIYNTFPLMGDTLIPREFLMTSPWWEDFFENPVSVQFLHRLCAIVTILFCSGLWSYHRTFNLPVALKRGFNGMIIAVLLQFSLGLLTLLFIVPIPLALLHQGVAFVVFGSLVYLLFLLKNFSKSTLK